MNKDDHQRHKPKISVVIRALIAFAILAAACIIAYGMIANPKHADKKIEHAQSKSVVKTTKITLGDYPVKIEVMGRVIPAHETALKARVSGEIIGTSENFIPGGFFKKDETLLKVDPADYVLEVNVKEAALKQAQASFRLEQGQQQIARDEMSILERNSGKKMKITDLALRKPQLEQAKANIDSAQTNLEIAQLNLERTEIKSPFNAIMIERLTDLGNIISSQDQLATLVNTDEYWVEIEVPTQNSRWLQIPVRAGDKGSQAIITLDDGRKKRRGSLLRQTGALNEQSRLAYMIVSVPDPLLLNAHDADAAPMVLEDFVPVTLIGKTLKNAARVEQSYVREDNTVWAMRNGKLAIQPVTIVYKDRDYAYITDGLEQDTDIITSNIITPVDGMDISRQDEDAQDTNDAEIPSAMEKE
tara:strand:+ start:645 stop:1892 length:1248 start_codon:yes stop_codon:yes gene_type:complete